MKRILFSSLCFIASLGSAQAALTLVINQGNQTVQWTGSVTSSPITVPDASVATYFVTDSVGSNNATGASAVVGLDSTMTFNTNLVGGTGVSASTTDGRTFVTNNATYQQIALPLDTVINFSGSDATATFTITVNDSTPRSYAGLSMDEISYVESLANGTQLFFTDPTSLANHGLAGSVSVVPEPSSVLLVALSGIALVAWKSRKRFEEERRGAVERGE